MRIKYWLVGSLFIVISILLFPICWPMYKIGLFYDKMITYFANTINKIYSDTD